jgi:hypothetical protein
MISKPVDILVIAALAMVPFLAVVLFWHGRFRKKVRIAQSPLDESPNELAADSELPDQVPIFRRREVRIAILLYEVLLSIGVATFYTNSSVKVWRIRKALDHTGVSQSVDIHIANGNAILTGTIPTWRLSARTSREVAAIAGPAHVINQLRLQFPGISENPSELLGDAEVTVNTDYDDSSRSLQEIGAILHLPQYQVILVSRSSSISRVIAQQYGIIRSKLPKSFAIVAAAIRNLNNLDQAVRLRPGGLRIPVLPPRHVTLRPRVERRGQIQLPGFLDLINNGPSGALQRVEISERFRPIGSNRVILTLPFTRGTAQQTQQVSEVLPFSVLRSTMRIRFAGGGNSGVLHQTLADEDKGAIMKVLSLAKRSAVVFVLDAGWPDELTYRTSLAELQKLVDGARSFYGLRPVQWNAPMTTDEFRAIEPPQHCVDIQRSLQEFNGLDHNHVVKVVYVPLSRKQNSDQILGEMLKLFPILYKVGHNSNLTQAARDAFSKEGEDSVSSVLNHLRPTLPDIPYAPGWGAPEDQYDEIWETDSSVVGAVWYLADLASYLDVNHTGYFLNESWTVLPDRIHLLAPAKSMGITVAAVGNGIGMTVNSPPGEIEFARLATPATNVLAALDAKPGSDEPDCNSSQIAESDVDVTMAAGFDGKVTESDKPVCGSSFSAPRIAWILALGETVRTDSPDADHWARTVQQKLLSARAPAPGLQWKRLYLHPKAFFP